MTNKLSEDKIEEILDTWEEMDKPSYLAVSKEVDVHRDTVKRYVEKEYGDSEDLPDDVGSSPGLENSDEDDEKVFKQPGERMAEDFIQYFEKLNEDGGFGIKEKAIKMMAGEVKTHNQLPSPSDVSAFLESADSGVSNSQELMWISRQYGAWVQQYRTKHAHAQPGGGMGMGGGGMMGGQGQSAFGQGQGQGGMMGGAPGQPMMGGAAGGNPNQAMMMIIQQMQQQMQELRQDLNQSSGEDSGDMLEEKTQEFLEAKIDQLIDADSTAEQEAVVKELRSLRSEMQQSPERHSAQLGDDWRSDLITLAQQGEIDMQEAKDILQEVGEIETDPRVLEKKHEKEIKEMELKQKTERDEKIGGMLENLVEKGSEAFADRIVNGGAETGQEQADAGQQAGADAADDTAPTDAPAERSQPTQARSPIDMSDGSGTCPHCHSEITMGQGGATCPECEWGISQCDLCTHPIEVPPIGEANYASCVECDNELERPSDADEAVECDECGWAGTAEDLPNELVYCDNCNSYRPIMRQAAALEATEMLEERMGD